MSIYLGKTLIPGVVTGAAAVSVSGIDEETFNAHVNNANNPHGVTAEQIGALPTGVTINGKALYNFITLTAEDVGAATEEYVNNAITAIPTPDISGQITTHNNDTSAHTDIRDAIPTKASDLGLKTESWTFTLEDGSTVTKAVYVG